MLEKSIYIVIPILTLLMFDIGLSLSVKDFKLLRKESRAIAAGLIGQLIVLPVVAFFIGCISNMPTVWFIGFMLIACSPGGSSSNVFTMLARGDVALSVTLTALSSVFTLVTMPFIMWCTVKFLGNSYDLLQGNVINLPVGNLFMQNVVLVALPVVFGIVIRRFFGPQVKSLHRVLMRLAFPMLLLLAVIFFIQNVDAIVENIAQLGLVTALLIIVSMLCGKAMAYRFDLEPRQSRTVVIEIGMQNAAQAIAVAVSPLIFNNQLIAIPAIVYALLMNVILLTYVAWFNRGGKKTS
ncbi:MAG: bile acid:sodium symporter family protein [Muribaculaceae bacterium]|nr:bile acid:sodium symporter family protein [Muribaculaceae bacterium]